MIDIGELKLGDRVRDNVTNNTWFVSNIEYLRSVDDEHEEITVALEKNPSVYEQFCPPTNVFETIKERKSMKNFLTNKYRVIVNDPAVILFVTDGIHTAQKYVSKAHNEPFDVEKGLLMCLAKANGISHLDLKRMIKNAKVQKKKQEMQDDSKDAVNFAMEHETFRNMMKEIITVKEKREERLKTTVEFLDDIEVLSPKGKHRGRPFKFYVGDKVVIRECYEYVYERPADVKSMLNKKWEINDVYVTTDDVDFYQIVNGDKKMLFANNELDRL